MRKQVTVVLKRSDKVRLTAQNCALSLGEFIITLGATTKSTCSVVACKPLYLSPGNDAELLPRASTHWTRKSTLYLRILIHGSPLSYH